MSLRDDVARLLSRAHADDALEPALAVVRSHVNRLADELASFDCLVDKVPDGIDVPDDYERGINDAARFVRALFEEQTEDER